MTAILTGMRCYLTVALIFFSLIFSDVEHLFMSLLSIYLFSLEKYLFMPSAHFLIGVSVSLLFELYEQFVYFGNEIFVDCIISKHIPACRPSLHFFWIAMQKLIRLVRSHLFIFAFISVGRLTRKLWCNLYQKIFCLCSLLGVWY